MSGLVRTKTDYFHLLNEIKHAMTVAVDTETTGLHPYTVDEIRGISVGWPDHSFYLPISHPDSKNFDPTDLVKELKKKMLIFHHGVFDWAFLDQVDSSVDWAKNTVWDTQVVNWMIDENLKVGLKESCERIFGVDAGDEKRHLKALKGKTWGTYSAEDIGAYAAMDAELTWRLFCWQTRYIKTLETPFGVTEVARELRVQQSLYTMIQTGIKVDPEKILDGEAAFMEKIRAIEDVFTQAGVNPNSPKQVAKWLFGAIPAGTGGDAVLYQPSVKTKTGQPSVAKNVLEDLAQQGHPYAKALLEYRHLSKAVTGYFRPMHSQIGEDGRLHAHFSSTRTVTGRFSCSSPNLQTIPREDTMPEVRACFVPEEGYQLWGFDLAQAELRVIAGFADETTMIEALEEGRDLHSETAESIFGPGFTPLQRRLAKNLNFGFAYGIGPAKFATYFAPVPTKADVAQAKQILEGYKRTYPNVAALLTGMEKIAKTKGYVSSHVPGRYRHFRGPGYTAEFYTAVNYIVQGGIGEFMKDVMNHWYNDYTHDSLRLVLQVHDELVFEVWDGDGEGEDRATLVQRRLQEISDHLAPFKMRMIFERKKWG